MADHNLFAGLKADRRITVSYKNAGYTSRLLLPVQANDPPGNMFADITDSISLPYKHHENDFVDFNVQAFIPHMLSTAGPKLAVADINGDDLDDFYICGARNQAGELFMQTSSGKFISTNKLLFLKDAGCENVNAVFFDADRDGDKDLYVVNGGNEFQYDNPRLLDCMYINNGKGIFKKQDILPQLYGNKSVAIPSDIDHDGDLDLFVGGRVVAGSYGEIPGSYLLLNNGKGSFVVGNESIAPGLRKIGMVTDAVWTDVDRDGWTDLVIAGEWMPVTVFKNERGKLQNKTITWGLANTTGLWTTIHAADINNDGFEDLLAGNLGENSKLRASEKYPLKFFAGDLDDNGAPDQVLATEKNGKYYSFRGKEDFEKQLPGLMRKEFVNYADFAGQTIEEVFGTKLEHTKKLTASMLSSMLLVNNGSTYNILKLPARVQWSPVFAFFTGDFNADQKMDVIAAGNFYGVLPFEGRYDASNGTVLLGKDTFDFQSLSALQSSLMIEGEVRDIKMLRMAGNKRIIAVARNNEQILFYTIR